MEYLAAGLEDVLRDLRPRGAQHLSHLLAGGGARARVLDNDGAFCAREEILEKSRRLAEDPVPDKAGLRVRCARQRAVDHLSRHFTCPSLP